MSLDAFIPRGSNGGVTRLTQLSDFPANGLNGRVTTSSKLAAGGSVAWSHMARVPRSFICAHCGKPAQSQHLNPKYCCRACASRAYNKVHVGDKRHCWKGGRRLTPEGYVQVYAGVKKHVLEHRAIAERALGHPLPPHAVIHHVDGDESNNAPGNLVICENHAEHVLMHHKKRRLDDTGSLALRRCGRCHIVKELAEFHNRKTVWDGKRSECKVCEEQRRRERRTA